MISLSASPACGPRFLAGWASWLSSRASQCGPKAWQKSSNWQKSSTSRSNIDVSAHLMAPTQKEEFKGDKGLASPQTRNSGLIGRGTAKPRLVRDCTTIHDCHRPPVFAVMIAQDPAKIAAEVSH